MLPKKHLSGAQKRKKKKQEDEFSSKSINCLSFVSSILMCSIVMRVNDITYKFMKHMFSLKSP
jgi:hypothetical protein